MCDCFDKVEANLKEKTGDPEASLNYMYAMPSFEKKPVIEAHFLPVALKYFREIISLRYAQLIFIKQVGSA